MMKSGAVWKIMLAVEKADEGLANPVMQRVFEMLCDEWIRLKREEGDA